MKPLTLREVRQGAGARTLAPISDDTPVIRAVCTDTRQMERNSLFFAIKGNFDGHAYLAQARRAAAIAAVVDRAPEQPVAGLFLFVVPTRASRWGGLAALCPSAAAR